MVRVNELIRRELGDALFRLMNERAFDLSAVTITHVVASSNLRTARVLVSIRDHQDERERMMDLLRHHRAEMQERINTNLKLKYTPRLTFELDTSIERGDHVLELLTQMDGAPPEPTPEEDIP